MALNQTYPQPKPITSTTIRAFSKYVLATLGLCVTMAFSSFANAKDTLTVYTYDAFTAEWGAGPIVKAAFEKTCDCELKFVALDSSAGILNRVQLEGDATPTQSKCLAKTNH